MYISLILVSVVVLAVCLWRLLKFSVTSSADAEAELLRHCFGDCKQMQRLIALEVERAPEISPAEATNRALRSIRRDR